MLLAGHLQGCAVLQEKDGRRQTDGTAESLRHVHGHSRHSHGHRVCSPRTWLECRGLAAREDRACRPPAPQHSLLASCQPGREQQLLVSRGWGEDWTGQCCRTSQPLAPLHVQGSYSTTKGWHCYGSLLKLCLQLLSPHRLSPSSLWGLQLPAVPSTRV